MKTVILNVVSALLMVILAMEKTMPENWKVWLALGTAVLNVVARVINDKWVSMGKMAYKGEK